MSTGQAGAEIGIGIGTTLNCNHEAPIVTHALRGEGFDASEDGTGRGTPLIVTPPLTGNPYGDHESREGLLVPVAHLDVLPCMQNGSDTPAGHNARPGNTKDSYIVPMAFSNVSDGSSARNATDICDPLTTRHGDPGMVAYPVGVTVSQNSNGFAWESDISHTLQAKAESGGANQFSGIRQGMAVRRLTPRECERLQGFPDDYTLVPSGKRMMADGPRYKMLGNSMAVPVMRWIGERIQLIDALPPSSAGE